VAADDGLDVQAEVGDRLVELGGEAAALDAGFGHGWGGVPQVRLERNLRPAQVDDHHVVGVVIQDAVDPQLTAVSDGQDDRFGDRADRDGPSDQRTE
jgi:hypothetical protein